MTDLIFDGHNDILSRIWCGFSDAEAAFSATDFHVTARNAKAGGLAGGFFALFAVGARAPFDFAKYANGNVPMPVAPRIERPQALDAIVAQIGVGKRLERAGHLSFAHSGTELRAHIAAGRLAGLLHLEGADPIDPDFFVLDALYAQGLRSLGLVWSRYTVFGEGVPFAADQDGDTGAGLTDLGKALVARCQELGVIVDTSHLTMRGFWDVAEAGGPLVATHSNAYSVCKVTRNLTDEQLKAVGETNGMVGLNFGTLFLSDEGWSTGRANISDMIRQLDYMIEQAGEDHVGMGSDFDGAPMPDEIESAADLPKLVDAMRRAYYGEALISKLLKDNWLNFLTRELG